MPEARIRVTALYLARARTLPLLCLGIGRGLQSRPLDHARSALKQQQLPSAPIAPHRRTPPYVYARRSSSFYPRSPKKAAQPIVAVDKKTPHQPLQTMHPLPRSSKNLRLWTDTSL